LAWKTGVDAGCECVKIARTVVPPLIIMTLRHFIPPIILGLLVSAGAGATDVVVSGLFPNKALVQIDGGALQTLSVGQKTTQGVTLISVETDTATFEIEGKRYTLGLGNARIARSSSAASVFLVADTRGFFVTDAQINGKPIQFIVDTGASVITLPSGEARRLDIDYQKGQRVTMATANGTARGYRIKLDTVSVGNIMLNSVDAVVLEGDGLTKSLLGMSFLSRMNMKREGDHMTLTKRY
jgi:aspartyl protease family protein